MNDKRTESGRSDWLVLSSLYAVLVLAFAGFLNYTEPYSSDPVAAPGFWDLVLWGACYLPVMILPIAAGWKVADFGFTLNPFLGFAASLIVAVCAFSTPTAIAAWQSAFFEAFARTGEEVFFRGFLFVLFSELFQGKRRPWLWAATASSIIFALVHTQVFQPGYLAAYGNPSLPAAYQIIERLLNIFGLSFVFALLRVWTHSVLPGTIAHGLLNGGLATLPFVLLIYGALTLWAHCRGEPVLLKAMGLNQLT